VITNPTCDHESDLRFENNDGRASDESHARTSGAVRERDLQRRWMGQEWCKPRTIRTAIVCTWRCARALESSGVW